MRSVRRHQGMVTVAFGCWCFVLIKAQGSVEEGMQLRCDELCDYSAWSRHAYCGERGLTDIPVQCNSVKTLDVRLNRIDTLHQGRLAMFRSLKYLYMVDVGLQDVEEGAFQGCNALQLLSWSGNAFSDLHSAWLEGLHNLKFMLLDRSQLQRIEAGAFNQTPLLQTLDLSGNKFVSPPCDAFGPDNLVTEFYLNDNLISSIPENCFAKLRNLQRITLNDNPIGNVPMSALAGLTSLKTIELANASLSTVPVGALSPLRKVTHLKMARNLITALEERDFSVLPEAEYVDLSYNRIRFVHEHAFANMLRLKVLILSSNKIAIIGWRAFIPVESTLEELHLHENQLQSIGNISASTILSLQTLLLADNPLQCHCHLSEYRYFLRTRQHLLQVQGGHGKCIDPWSETEVSVLESSLTETACPSVSTSARPSDPDPDYTQVPAVPIVPAAIVNPEREGGYSTNDPTFLVLIIVASVTVAVLALFLIVVACFRISDCRSHTTPREDSKDEKYVQVPVYECVPTNLTKA